MSSRVIAHHSHSFNKNKNKKIKQIRIIWSIWIEQKETTNIIGITALYTDPYRIKKEIWKIGSFRDVVISIDWNVYESALIRAWTMRATTKQDVTTWSRAIDRLHVYACVLNYCLVTRINDRGTVYSIYTMCNELSLSLSHSSTIGEYPWKLRKDQWNPLRVKRKTVWLIWERQKERLWARTFFVN